MTRSPRGISPSIETNFYSDDAYPFSDATRDDLLVPYSRSLRLAEGLPNANLVLTVAGGHAVNVTYPQTFNSAVIDFLSTLEHA